MKKVKNPNTSCAFCIKGIYRKPFHIKKSNYSFCSKDCQGKFYSEKKEVKCANCSISVIKTQKALNKSISGNVFCSHECSNQNRVTTDAKFTYRERALKFYGEKCSNKDCKISKVLDISRKMLDVDHIDSDRTNNIIDNLQVLCVWCHALKTRKVN